MNRRSFLATSAGLAGGAWWSAVRGRAWAAGTDTVGDADLAELKKLLGERLVAPSDATYDLVRKVRNRAFDGVKPRAVVMARSVDDVRHAVQWAAAHKVPVVPRCGGHSYIGGSVSEGLVISLVNMNKVRLDKATMRATVEAGTLLVDVNAGLVPKGVGLPTGSCPSVGVAGLTLGGGIGFSSRKWGLMCDNLVGVTLVTASGEVIEADEANKPEVLWACRGGGGGHFGVVTRFVFRVHEVEPISGYSIKWPWKSAGKVLEAWQKWAPDAPDELFSVCMVAHGKEEPRIHSHGRFHGSKKALREVLEPLIAAAKPTKRPSVYDSTLKKAVLEGPKCWPDTTQCHSWNHPQPGRYKQATYKVKSDYFSQPLSSDGIGALIAAMEAGQKTSISWGGVILDALGGAINRVAPDATAFVHRTQRVQAEYVAHWSRRASQAKAEANLAWMREMYAAMRPYASGECYQNYPDLDLKDWKTAYYGANLARLQRCKKVLDPGRVFDGRQILDPG